MAFGFFLWPPFPVVSSAGVLWQPVECSANSPSFSPVFHSFSLLLPDSLLASSGCVLSVPPEGGTVSVSPTSAESPEIRVRSNELDCTFWQHIIMSSLDALGQKGIISGE